MFFENIMKSITESMKEFQAFFQKNKDIKSLFLGVVVLIFILWLLTWIVLYIGFTKWEERGQFGDMFGAVNSLFSGMAFAGIIIAIILQKQELELQRKELEFTREELRRSAKAQEKAEEALSKQVYFLKETASINALTTVIENYDRKLKSCGSIEKMGIELKQKYYIELLEVKLEGLKEQKNNN